MTERPRIHLLTGDDPVPDPAREALAALGELVEIPRPDPDHPGLADSSLLVIPESERSGAAELLRHLADRATVPTLLLHTTTGAVPEGLADFDDAARIDRPDDLSKRARLLLEFREARARTREYGLTQEDLRAELVRYGLDPDLADGNGLVPPGRVKVENIVDVEALNRQQMSICRLMGTAFGTFLYAPRPQGLRQGADDEFAPTGALSPYCAYLSAQGGRCLKAEYEAARRALLIEEPVETTCSGQVRIYSAPICIRFEGAVYPLLAVSVAAGGVPDQSVVPEVGERYGVNREILEQMAQESRFWVLNPDKADEIRSTFRNLSETISREVSNKYGTAWQIYRSLLTEREILNSRSLIAASNDALEQTNRKLRSKNEEIYEVTHAITHDLRKPLASLKATLGLIRTGRLGEIPERQVEALETAWESTRYMSDLVTDLLEAARLDAGRKVLEIGKVDVRAVVEKVRRRLAPMMEETGIAFETAGEPVLLAADETAVEKVLMNLVGNAISYIGEGEKTILVRVGVDDGVGVVSVEDTGVGIPEGSLPHVFEKFRRGDNVGGIPGTGLGLTIVKGLVDAQGGSVEIVNREGGGAAARIRLPLAPEPAAEEAFGLTGEARAGR